MQISVPPFHSSPELTEIMDAKMVDLFELDPNFTVVTFSLSMKYVDINVRKTSIILKIQTNSPSPVRTHANTLPLVLGNYPLLCLLHCRDSDAGTGECPSSRSISYSTYQIRRRLIDTGMALSDRTIRLQRQFFAMQLLQVSTILPLFLVSFIYTRLGHYNNIIWT